MADIFISYANEDRSRAEPFARALESQGWSVWRGHKGPSGTTAAPVREATTTDAKCVVVLWSYHSIESEGVKEEAGMGKRRDVLVPARIDTVEPPLGFRLQRAVDLIDWCADEPHAEFNGLINTITAIAGPPHGNRDH